MNREEAKPGARGGAASGFTLVELLVAMTILSLLSVIMVGGLHLGARYWEQNERGESSIEEVLAVQAALRRHFHALYPVWVRGASDPGHTDFVGTSGRMEFTTAPPRPLAPAANRRAVFDVSTSGELDLAWWDPLSAAAAPELQTVLLRHVKSIDLAYFGGTGNARRWRDSWSGGSAPPELIRVRVTFLDGDHHSWPELLVHPMVVVDSSCLFDPVGLGCRGR